MKFNYLPPSDLMFKIQSLTKVCYICLFLVSAESLPVCYFHDRVNLKSRLFMQWNHLHSLVFTKNEQDTINNIIGETKRFMAYEIVKRLRRGGRKDLLKIIHDTVGPNEAKKNKYHNLFQTSADIKEIVTEKFISQKLNYVYKNPVSGKWKLVDDYSDYIHTSARFYDFRSQSGEIV